MSDRISFDGLGRDCIKKKYGSTDDEIMLFASRMQFASTGDRSIDNRNMMHKLLLVTYNIVMFLGIRIPAL